MRRLVLAVCALLLACAGCATGGSKGAVTMVPEKTTTVQTSAASAADVTAAGTAAATSAFVMPDSLNDLDYSGYSLAWSDEFEADSLDPAVWNHETGYIRNHELQYYTDGDENARLQDGMLVIEGVKSPEGSERAYTSASINTQHKRAFQYGIFEIRAKLPYGQGIWPAFWMMGDEPESPVGSYRWPACGEIDVLEMVGGGREADATAYATAHWGGVNPYWYKNSADVSGSERKYTLPDGVYHDDFHIFTVEWIEKELRWYVDGHRFFRQSITGEGMEAFHKPFFVLLNLAIGGDWPGSPTASTVFPQQYVIDYVRVYQKR